MTAGRRGDAAAVVLALALDAATGEPPPALHPVVGIGAFLRRAERVVPPAPPGRAVLAGGAACAAGLAGSWAGGMAAAAVAWRLPLVPSVAVRAVALWPLLSARLLLAEVAAVEAALARDLDAGRAALSRVVSRDTAALDAAEVRAAALESLAENLSDSVVAPLWWYAAGGLPAAAAYRFANTADACWGYRTARWQHAGRVAARTDDLANLVPARLTAVLLLLGAPRATWRRLPAEAARTPSPNAGWPMAALALRLGRRLPKRGAYALNPAGSAVAPGDVPVALSLARRTVALATVATTAALWRRERSRRCRCPR